MWEFKQILELFYVSTMIIDVLVLNWPTSYANTHTHIQAKWVQTNADSVSLSLCLSLFPGGKTMLSFRYQIRSDLLDRKRGRRLRTRQERDLGNVMGEFTCEGNVYVTLSIFTSGSNSACVKVRFPPFWRLHDYGQINTSASRVISELCDPSWLPDPRGAVAHPVISREPSQITFLKCFFFSFFTPDVPLWSWVEIIYCLLAPSSPAFCHFEFPFQPLFALIFLSFHHPLTPPLARALWSCYSSV